MRSPEPPANSPRKINEGERSGWTQGPRDLKSPEISINFSLFGYLREARCRPGAEIQNISVCVRLVVFGHVRILYIDFSSRFTCDLIYSA